MDTEGVPNEQIMKTELGDQCSSAAHNQKVEEEKASDIFRLNQFHTKDNYVIMDVYNSPSSRH